MTLGNAAAARVRLIVWCKGCQYHVEPDPAEMAERYGAETTVPDWAARLVCGLMRLPSGQHGSERDPLAATGTPQGQLSALSDLRPARLDRLSRMEFMRLMTRPIKISNRKI